MSLASFHLLGTDLNHVMVLRRLRSAELRILTSEYRLMRPLRHLSRLQNILATTHQHLRDSTAIIRTSGQDRLGWH